LKVVIGKAGIVVVPKGNIKADATNRGAIAGIQVVFDAGRYSDIVVDVRLPDRRKPGRAGPDTGIQAIAVIILGTAKYLRRAASIITPAGEIGIGNTEVAGNFGEHRIG